MKYLKKRIDAAIEYEISAFINEISEEVDKIIEQFVRDLPSGAGHNAALESEILLKVHNARLQVMQKHGIKIDDSRYPHKALPYGELYRLYPFRNKLPKN